MGSCQHGPITDAPGVAGDTRQSPILLSVPCLAGNLKSPRKRQGMWERAPHTRSAGRLRYWSLPSPPKLYCTQLALTETWGCRGASANLSQLCAGPLIHPTPSPKPTFTAIQTLTFRAGLLHCSPHLLGQLGPHLFPFFLPASWFVMGGRRREADSQPSGQLLVGHWPLLYVSSYQANMWARACVTRGRRGQ